MGSLVWLVVAGFGVALAAFLMCCAWWMTHSEVGVDPFAGLPSFDDDEAAALLEAGA